jgi:hypothetical protein
MDNNLGAGLLLMLSIQAVLMIAQAAILAPESAGGYGGTNTFYHSNGTLLSSYDKNSLATGTTPTLTAETNPATLLPDNPAQDNNFFTDVFTSIKNFFSNTLGLRYVTALLSAPAHIIGLIIPIPEIAFALAAVWYGTMMLLIFAFFWGR